MTDDRPHLEARGAIEALRSGVPNRTAIRLLGERDGALVDSFSLRSGAAPRASNMGGKRRELSSGADSGPGSRTCSASCGSAPCNGTSSSASCR